MGPDKNLAGLTGVFMPAERRSYCRLHHGDDLISESHYQSPAEWRDSAEGMVPHHNPVFVGNDINGEPIYVGRAIHNGDTIPGKVVPSHHVCYVTYDGREHSHHEYQMLTNPHNTELVWIPSNPNRPVPTGALIGGRQANGVPLYIGRTYYKGSMVVGKVHPEHRSCYVSFSGVEIPINSYEVLATR